jgi:uncharacterized membrane protein YgdD (TMEM256/DUF423 family)
VTTPRIFMVMTALFGASGVGLLATGSHGGNPLAATAGQMLLFHAPALMAATLARETGHLDKKISLAAIAIMAAGVAIFSADLAVRTQGWQRLFPMAAPIGGSLTILSWLVLAAAALRPR